MTSSSLLASSAVGASFGSALLISGVANPSTIVGQFQLRDFHMVAAFLTAASVSTVVIYVSNRTGYVKLAPRSCAEYELPPLKGLGLGRYAGNIVGGCFQGVAMAVSGACPGTVLVQVALGWGMGTWALFGQVLGGLVFVRMQEYLRVGSGRNAVKKAKVQDNASVNGRGEGVAEKLGVSTELVVVLYEVVMVAVVALVSLFAPMGTYWRNAVVGGGLIGMAQAGSVLFSKKTLGVSTAYSDVAGHLWTLIDGKRARPGWNSIVFALGVMAGAYACRGYVPPSQSMPLLMRDRAMVDISLPAAILGGALSAFGARLAGGCTSGHGISGCSTLSVSSLITVASMFTSGIAFKVFF